jgi:hypothetical protein
MAMIGMAPAPAESVLRPVGAVTMPIRELLQDQAFGPDEIAVMVKAFEGACEHCDWSHRPRNGIGRKENH